MERLKDGRELNWQAWGIVSSPNKPDIYFGRCIFDPFVLESAIPAMEVRPCWRVVNSCGWKKHFVTFPRRHNAQVRCEDKVHTGHIRVDIATRHHHPVLLLPVSCFCRGSTRDSMTWYPGLFTMLQGAVLHLPPPMGPRLPRRHHLLRPRQLHPGHFHGPGRHPQRYVLQRPRHLDNNT